MSTAIYLDRSGAAQALALSESTLEKLVREDETFPKPRRLSANRVGWLRRELDAWAESRCSICRRRGIRAGGRSARRGEGAAKPSWLYVDRARGTITELVGIDMALYRRRERKPRLAGSASRAMAERVAQVCCAGERDGRAGALNR